MKICLECESTFNGRSDKKFCGVKCRNTYNNNLHSLRNNSIKFITLVLLRNRRILELLGQKPVIEMEELRAHGFNFQYFTHLQNDPGGDIRFCFDMGYWVDRTEQVCKVYLIER